MDKFKLFVALSVRFRRPKSMYCRIADIGQATYLQDVLGRAVQATHELSREGCGYGRSKGILSNARMRRRQGFPFECEIWGDMDGSFVSCFTASTNQNASAIIHVFLVAKGTWTTVVNDRGCWSAFSRGTPVVVTQSVG